jgi:hypothetical protein
MYPCMMQFPECTDIEDSHFKRTVTFNVYICLMVNDLVFIGYVFIIVNISVSVLGLNCMCVNQFHTKFTLLEGQWICSQIYSKIYAMPTYSIFICIYIF